VIGVASTAPAYSLAASLGFVVLTANGAGLVGVKAPSIMLLAFVPMLLIAFAYQELNRAEPDCGTTFTWAARAFGPRVGWMGGWGISAADIIVMVIWNAVRPAYFRGETLPKRDARDLELVISAHEGQTLRLPGAGLPEIVIAPDLSNLPPGATAVEAGIDRPPDDDPPTPAPPTPAPPTPAPPGPPR
jgi:hypothetical protein